MRKILPRLGAVLSVLIAGMVSFWALQERQSAMAELQRIQASGEQPKSAGHTGDEQIRRQLEELSHAHQRELERLRDSYERELRASAEAQAQAKADPTLKASGSGRDTQSRVAELARNVEELKRLQTASVSGAVPATAPSSAASSVPQRPAVALRPGKVAWNTPPTAPS